MYNIYWKEVPGGISSLQPGILPPSQPQGRKGGTQRLRQDYRFKVLPRLFSCCLS